MDKRIEDIPNAIRVKAAPKRIEDKKHPIETIEGAIKVKDAPLA